LSPNQSDNDSVDLHELREALDRAWSEYQQAAAPEEKCEKLQQYRLLLKQFTEEAMRRSFL
jgi:hypothetical protein